MRLASKLLAAALAYCLALHPTVACAQTVQVQAGAAQVGVPYVPVGTLSGIQTSGSLSSGLQAPSLTPGVLATLPAVQIAPQSAPAAIRALPLSSVSSSRALPLNHSVSPSAVPASESIIMVAANAASPAAMPLSLTKAAVAAPVQGRAAASHRLSAISVEVAEAGRDLPNLSGASAHEAVGRQFRTLTGERVRSSGADSAEPVAVPQTPALGESARLRPASETAEAAAEPKAEVPQAKGSLTKVFKDSSRNKAFWRYTVGYTLFMMGYEMYATALPFLISAFTRNTLRENNDQRLANADAVKMLIRQNRSFARIAHYAAQAVSYFTVPLFSNDDGGNNGKWLSRSCLIRAGIILLIPTVFFASGVFSLQGALWTLFGLLAFQSFVQGITVTMDSAVTAQITGDKSVTDSERIRANSIFTFVAALTAIIGPAIAGQIAQVQDLFGKTGVGSAILYGLYGVFIGLAGLAYAAIRLAAAKVKGAPSPQGQDGTAAKRLSLRSVLGELWGAMRDGVVLIMKNRFLRTMLFLTLIISLFSDPLIFNVLPEYVESVLTASPDTLGWLMNIPVVGWVLKGMTSTPTGYFSLLIVFASLGSIVASLLIAPLRRLLNRLGMKTEESQVMPLYFLAALEAPLFWLMLSTPSALTVVTLYGLQTLVTAFAAMLLSGLHQKTLGSYTSEEMNKILAAESMLGIIATVVSTALYGFILGNIPIATSMLIAAVAISMLAAFRIVAPWMYFSKEERSRKPAEPKPASAS